jgi:hypothetical protein
MWSKVTTYDSTSNTRKNSALYVRTCKELHGQLGEKYFDYSPDCWDNSKNKYFDYFVFNIVNYGVNSGFPRLGARRRALA